MPIIGHDRPFRFYLVCAAAPIIPGTHPLPIISRQGILYRTVPHYIVRWQFRCPFCTLPLLFSHVIYVIHDTRAGWKRFSSLVWSPFYYALSHALYQWQRCRALYRPHSHYRTISRPNSIVQARTISRHSAMDRVEHALFSTRYFYLIDIMLLVPSRANHGVFTGPIDRSIPLSHAT